MSRPSSSRRRRVALRFHCAGAAAVAVCLAVAVAASPAAAQGGGLPASSTLKAASPDRTGGATGGLVTKRRTLGVAFLAGSAVLAAKGFDYKDQADEFYDLYEAATDEAEIDKFYQRTTNRDVKSQVSWALATAFGITGLRLVFTGGDRFAPAAVPASSSSRVGLLLVPSATPGTVGLHLQRRFY